MRKLTLLAALAAVIVAPGLASAMGPNFDQFGFRRRSAPRAAPWYLYWPAAAHFQTPAPTGYNGGFGPMTASPYAGQIGPNAGIQYPSYPGSTGYNY